MRGGWGWCRGKLLFLRMESYSVSNLNAIFRMKRIFISCLVAGCALSAFGWGQKGHDTTAYIAEQHLTPTTKAAVDKILEGKSLVYWANWLDNASHTPDFAFTKTWHYKNVDEGVRYEEAPANPAGDAVTAIKGQIETLMNPDASQTDKNFAMRVIVHVTGDLHQPMHMGHATDMGGNRIPVGFFRDKKNLHSVWDTNIVESGHKWSYTEWQQQVDRVTPEEEESIIDGTIDDWAKETMNIAALVYRQTPPNTVLQYNEVAYWTPFIETQFLRGGLRLAHMLNAIFDPAYASTHTAAYTPAK